MVKISPFIKNETKIPQRVIKVYNFEVARVSNFHSTANSMKGKFAKKKTTESEQVHFILSDQSAWPLTEFSKKKLRTFQGAFKDFL